MKTLALVVTLSLIALAAVQGVTPRDSFVSTVASVQPAPLFLSTREPGSPLSACPAALEEDYYSDASYTTKVGMCAITCQTWDLYVWGPPMTCTGTVTSYSKGGPLRMCPCPP